MYICMYCGATIEEENLRDTCKECGCDVIEEATKCVRCGEYFPLYEYGEVCENCVKEYSDFECCYDIVFDDKKEVKISSLIAYLLDEGDIEQILYEHILKRMPDIDCSGYIEKNKDWIVDAIEEEVTKYEQAKG